MLFLLGCEALRLLDGCHVIEDVAVGRLTPLDQVTLDFDLVLAQKNFGNVYFARLDKVLKQLVVLAADLPVDIEHRHAEILFLLFDPDLVR